MASVIALTKQAALRAASMCLALSIQVTADAAQSQSALDGLYFPAATTQTETDEYTRYELLEPGSGRFRIYYEVTAATAGATHYYNPIRKGSTATEESVQDAMTGKPLRFEVVKGEAVRKDPLMADADPAVDYIKV